MILEKLDVKIVDTTAKVPDPSAAVNLCKEVTVGEELVINYTYTDMGRQMIILDIGAPVSITGVWERGCLSHTDIPCGCKSSISIWKSDPRILEL